MVALVRLIARSLLAATFVSGGWDAAMRPGKRPQAVAALGIPEPELAVRANGMLMVVAGLAFALGVFPRLAAGLLAASLAPTTLAGHPYWKEEDLQKRQGQRIHFLKNLSMLGGLLLAAADDTYTPALGRARRAHRA